MLGWSPVRALIGSVAPAVTTTSERPMIAVYPAMPAVTARTIRIGLRSPSSHRRISHSRAKIGGMTAAVNLHENARPPTIALATKARRLPLRRNSQKRSTIPVIVARIGISIVTSGPWARRFGLRVNHHAARTIARGPYSRRLQ